MPALADRSLQVNLRALKPADLPLYQALYTDRQTMQFIGPCLTAPQAERSFHAALAGAQNLDRQQFLVPTLAASATAIGLCGLSAASESAEIGIIMLPEFRGRHLARSTLGALLNHAFEQFTGDWICVDYCALHLRAARLFASLGFVARDGFAAKDLARCHAWLTRGQWRQRSIIRSIN